MAELRPQPQSPALGALARMLGAARDAAGRVRIDSQLLGQTSLADMLSLPGAAGLAEDVSYFGPAAMLRPGSGRTLQTFKLDPRVLDAADVALNVSPLGALAAKGAARAARPVARAAGEAVNRAMLTGEGPLAAALAPVAPLSVVKPKGGNWLAGSIESAVEPLKQPLFPGRIPFGNDAQAIAAALGETPDSVLAVADPGSLAINRWLDKKLAGYLRNEMATPEDPVRALAERGVLHFEPQDPVLLSDTAFARTAAGFPRHGTAQSQLATDWEALSDNAIRAQTAGRLIAPEYEHPVYGRRDGVVAEFLSRDPWLAKVPPETPVYRLDANTDNELGFDHLIDELRNAMDPASGLPRNLMLQPKDLDKVTVPQAVERVAQINAWRAEQKAAADLARANNAASVEYRAYSTVPGTDLPNEKGLRWVELKVPEPSMQGLKSEYLPEVDMWRIVDKDGGVVSSGATEREAVGLLMRKERESNLSEALKYEGDTMGHCVGGYCPEVISGEKRIFSLRDAKGEPHVTIEVAPSKYPTPYDYWYDTQGGTRPSPEVQEFIRWVQDKKPERESLHKWYERWAEETGRPVAEPPPDIIQIKGKQNLAPKDDYLPFVQDFVKSGQWGRVGDIGNTGLVQLPDKSFITKQQLDEGIQRLTGEGEPSVNAEWFQRQIARDPSWWENARGAFEGFARGGPVRRYAEGGAVHAARYDPADIARRAASLMEEFDAA